MCVLKYAINIDVRNVVIHVSGIISVWESRKLVFMPKYVIFFLFYEVKVEATEISACIPIHFQNPGFPEIYMHAPVHHLLNFCSTIYMSVERIILTIFNGETIQVL